MPACRIACLLALLLIAPAWSQPAAPQPPAGKAPAAAGPDHPIIPVVFAFTPAAERSYGQPIAKLIVETTSHANDTLRKFHIDVQFRPATLIRVDYEEAGDGDFKKMLADLKGMEPVNRKRDATYAAVVVMLVGDRQLCSEAKPKAGPEDAYAVVSIYCVANRQPGFIQAMDRLAGVGGRDDPKKVWEKRGPEIADFRSRLRWKKIDTFASSNIGCDSRGAGTVTCLFTGRRFVIEKLSAHGDSVTTNTWAEKDIQAAPDCLILDENRLDCFAVDTEGFFIHGAGVTKPVWEKLAGKFIRTPKCVGLGSNAADCFVLGPKGTIRHAAWQNFRWGGWTDIKDAITSDLSCTTGVQHKIDCFARGSGGMWQLFWNGQSGGAERRGGGLTSPPECVSRGPGHIDCVARGDDHRMYHVAANNGKWGPWSSGGDDRLASDISCVTPERDRIDCFALVAGKPGLQQVVWDYNRWLPDWVALGGSFTAAPTCISPQPGHIACFERDAGAVYYKYWNGNAWYPQTPQ